MDPTTGIFTRLAYRIPPVAKVMGWVERLVDRYLTTGRIVGQGVDRLKRDLSATRLGKTTPVRLATAVVQEMGDDDATHMAASVSYYAILSLFPLVLGLSAVVGVVANSPERQEEIIEFIIEYLPGSEAFVRESVEGVVKLRAAFGIGSVLSLLWTGSAVFGSITRAVNRAWDVHKDLPFYKNKPRQIAMALGISLLFLLSVGITTVFQWATSIDTGDGSLSSLLGGGVVSGLLKMPALLVSFAIFAMVYKVLPNTKTYWKYIWVGAIVAAVLFEGGKNLFLWYLEHFAQYDQLYGNIASVIVLMVWTYLSALILILGAEIASEYGRLKEGVQRGQTIHEPS